MLVVTSRFGLVPCLRECRREQVMRAGEQRARAEPLASTQRILEHSSGSIPIAFLEQCFAQVDGGVYCQIPQPKRVDIGR